MYSINQKTQINHRKMEWRCSLLVILGLLTQVLSQENEITKIDLDSSHCHNCSSISKNSFDNFVDSIFGIISTISERNDNVNKTIYKLEHEVESLLEKAMDKDRYEIVEGLIEIQPDGEKRMADRTDLEESEGRALFSKYTYEYRMYQKVKNFIDTHVLSINLPNAAKFMGFRSFGLNKFLLPLFIGGQVLIKSVLLAMFLPSILGSFGKILGKGISQLSASSSQASYPPINAEEPTSYNSDQKDVMGYETNQQGAYAYPDMYGAMDPEANELGNVDMSRFGATGQHIPSKNSYYQNQINTANDYKVFQKIPASSMILSNYDPFYSPLLSRLDGIFARLGLAPSENAIIDGNMQIGGQSVHDVKLEGCREQLICLMYATPAKYAPYSNLVSAQISRELNELRRPVSDNPEILRFFRYMRAARRGQESMDCMRAFPACSSNAGPAHTMIAAYHDINKLVTARKLNN